MPELDVMLPVLTLKIALRLLVALPGIVIPAAESEPAPTAIVEFTAADGAFIVIAPVTVREFEPLIVIPLAVPAAFIVTVFATAAVSTVTVTPVGMTTSSEEVGTWPQSATHVPVVFQLPVAAVHVAASALFVEKAPIKTKAETNIPTEIKTFFKLNFILILVNNK
jgi:hypothetical protein